MTTNYIITQRVNNKIVTSSLNNEYPEKSGGDYKIVTRVSIEIMKKSHIALALTMGLLFASCHKISQRPDMKRTAVVLT
jgi:hypothetical protein